MLTIKSKSQQMPANSQIETAQFWKIFTSRLLIEKQFNYTLYHKEREGVQIFIKTG